MPEQKKVNLHQGTSECAIIDAPEILVSIPWRNILCIRCMNQMFVWEKIAIIDVIVIAILFHADIYSLILMGN